MRVISRRLLQGSRHDFGDKLHHLGVTVQLVKQPRIIVSDRTKIETLGFKQNLLWHGDADFGLWTLAESQDSASRTSSGLLIPSPGRFITCV